MISVNSGLVIAALLLLSVSPVLSQTSTQIGSQPTTGGLRVQIDNAGRLVQPVPEIVNKVSYNAIPSPKAGEPMVVTRSATTGRVVGATSNVAADKTLTLPETEKVVRLNGLFHAASRARTGADGKLESDCHFESYGKTQGRAHK